MEITLVVLCAGESSRFNLGVKKQWLRIDNQPLWLFVTNRIASMADFEKIIVVGHPNEIGYMENFSNEFKIVPGGSTRQHSIQNALKFVQTPYVMITDVARCCVPKSVISGLIENVSVADCIVPVLDASDTVVYAQDTIDRSKVKMIQTPQLSNTQILLQALQTTTEYTDESSAIKACRGSVVYIKGSDQSRKLTFGDEMQYISCLQKPSSDYFTGSGIDIHQFEDGKKMVLGGVKLDEPYGFKAHSDGDVLIHSVIDALLGAAGAGDIGEFFPDTDAKYKGADSKELLRVILKFIQNVGFEIVNIDLTVLAQQPKINPYKKLIKQSMSQLLGIAMDKINIKATTGEKMGFVGRSEGIAVLSSVNLKYYDWTKEV